MDKDSLPLLVLSGPTASGKSGVAIRAAKRLNAEIINADSVSLYKGFAIGSGAPRLQEQQGVPHHFLLSEDPAQPWDAGLFMQRCRARIDAINGRKRIALVVGGTGLYVQSLIEGIVHCPDITKDVIDEIQARESAFREKHAGDVSAVKAEMHAWLCECDPRAGERLHPHDAQRVQRALAVQIATGRSLFTLHDEEMVEALRCPVLVGLLDVERQLVYELVDARVDDMLASGLIEEVRQLCERYPKGVRALDAIGYRHVRLYVREELSYSEMVRLMKRDTRRFAKRQMTWWRNQPEKLGWKPLGNALGTSLADVAPEQQMIAFREAAQAGRLTGVYYSAMSRTYT